jgi:hypothetical protein
MTGSREFTGTARAGQGCFVCACCANSPSARAANQSVQFTETGAGKNHQINPDFSPPDACRHPIENTNEIALVNLRPD